MKLLSCEACAAVLDADMLSWMDVSRIFMDDGSVDTDHFTWSQKEEMYVPYINCPVCGAEVTEGESK